METAAVAHSRTTPLGSDHQQNARTGSPSTTDGHPAPRTEKRAGEHGGERGAGRAGRAEALPLAPAQAPTPPLAAGRASEAAPRRAEFVRGVRPLGAQDASSEMLRRLHDEVGKEQFERYFLGQTRLVMREGKLGVVVASGFLAQLIERRFAEQLRAITGASSVTFSVDREAFVSTPPAAPSGSGRVDARGGYAGGPWGGPGSHGPGGAARGEGAEQRRPLAQPKQTLRYSLDNFVVGAANRLAYAAATRLADPTSAPTPVFIHGACGMGKTHLVQGAAAMFLRARPDATVRYVTGETFTNGYIEALRANKMEQFRRMYRGADLLVLDDVHFIARKEQTQQELLHTFESLGLANARVLMASDEHPREIQEVTQKLASRFLSGAVVRIDAPDPELRRALIRQLALRRRLELDAGAVELLAERSEVGMGAFAGFNGSVRQLEGLLNTILAVCSHIPEVCRGGVVTSEVVRRALSLDARPAPARSEPGAPRRPIAVRTIVDEVCRALQVDVGEFMGRGRHKRVVFARSACAHLARELTTQSFPEIARAMGRTNHSTIITAQKRLMKQVQASPDAPVSAELAPNHAGAGLAQVLAMLAEQVRASAR